MHQMVKIYVTINKASAGDIEVSFNTELNNLGKIS